MQEHCLYIVVADSEWLEYIIQTPFYSRGFWSLLLYCVTDPGMPDPSSKLSGVIQTDSDVELSSIFNSVNELVNKHGRHPMLLPLQLFKAHYEMTSEAFNFVHENVTKVDSKLLRELETNTKSKNANELYRGLSKRLHSCSMKLAELSRRRKFEEELAARLQQDLKNDIKLHLTMSLYISMSKSRDSEIEGLPGKIESQRNVVSHGKSPFLQK